jgi:adenosine deaminase
MQWRNEPKGDHHVHLFLSAPFALYRSYGPQIPPPPERFAGFLPFNAYITEHLLPLAREWDIQAAIFHGALRRMEGDTVTNATVSIDVFTADACSRNWHDVSHDIRELFATFKGIIAADLGVSRQLVQNHDRCLQMMHQALATGLFSGIDLYGDELLTLTSSQIALLHHLAAHYNVAIKLHTGEQLSRASAAARMREEVTSLQPCAIMHGLAAQSDPWLLAYLKEHRIPLHLAISSNLALGYLTLETLFKVRKLYDAGVMITFGSDDFALFHREVSADYALLEEHGVFNSEEINEIVARSLSP